MLSFTEWMYSCISVVVLNISRLGPNGDTREAINSRNYLTVEWINMSSVNTIIPR